MQKAPAATIVFLVVLAALVASRGGAAQQRVVQVDPQGADYRVDAAQAERDGVPLLDEPVRAAPLRFADSVTLEDRQLILGAIAAMRPEARRVVDLVDGMVVMHVGVPPSATALGTAEHRGHGDYAVTLDLPKIWQAGGQRGVRTAVAHELAHVIDFALVQERVLASLDAGIPRGDLCDEHGRGGCAPPEERFAETFAKWATGDLGFELYMGYSVPAPLEPLETWAQPLSALTGA
jgi:hypothetical protein